MNKKAKRFTSVLLTVLMALSMFMTSFAAPAGGFEGMAELSGAEAVSEVIAAEAAEEQAEQAATPAEEIAEAQEEELLGAETDASPVYIGFTSDVHGNTSQLETWFKQVTESVSMKNMCYCGDYSYSSGNSYLSDFNTIVSLTDKYVGTNKGVYTTGNHCWSNGGSSVISSMEKTTGFVRLGEAKNVSTSAYRVYGFGASQGDAGGSFTSSDITKLEAYLKTVDTKIPVFILSHYPLHFHSFRTIGNADDVIDLLNKYPNAVFVWGHNHSQNDPHYNEVKTFGDSIEYKSGSSKQINFTYICAGSVYSSSQVEHGGTIVKVDGTKLTVTDYKYDGTTVLSIKNKNTDALTIDITNGTSGGDSDSGSTEPVPTGSGKYKETQSFENGKTYILTAASGGSVYALGSDGSGVKVTVDNGTIDTTNSAILWKAEQSGKGYKLTNVSTNKVLGKSDTKLYFNGTNGINWGYDASLKRVKNADSTSSSSNGIGYSNGQFSYPQSASQITLYAYSEGGSSPVVDPDVPSKTTVEITPSTDRPSKTANITVNESVTVNVTNGTKNNNTYTFTIETGDGSIASVDKTSIEIEPEKTKSFSITGKKAGKTTIKITGVIASSGGIWGWGGSSTGNERVATIEVTVTGSGSSEDPGETEGDPAVPSTEFINITPSTSNPQRDASIKVGERVTVNVTNGSENDNSYDFEISVSNGSSYVNLSTGKLSNVKPKATQSFTITGASVGNATVNILSSDAGGGDDYLRKATINVTVTAAPTEEDPEEPDSNTYSITWKNWNNTTLTTTTVNKGDVPSYPLPNPIRDEDVYATYTFAGWTPEVKAASADAVYTAVFTTVQKSYDVTWNVEGTKTTVPFPAGSTPSYGSTPTKAETSEFTYTFKGWDPAISEVKANVTYTAVFEATKKPVQPGGQTNVYLITFKLPDGTEMYAKVDEGVKPTYPGSTDPVKAADIYNTYKFAGWSPELTEATENAEYTAQFTPEARYYTITWIVNNIATDEQEKAGEMPVYNGTAPATIKIDGDTYNLEWSPALQKVTGKATYEGHYTKAGTTTGGGSTSGSGSTSGGGSGSSGGNSGGSSGGGVSGGVATAGGPTSAKGATATYSGNWYTDAAGIWRIKNNAGQVVANAWLCDDAIAANGQNVWYLLNADGSMIINGLVQDNTGNFYSIETNHNGYYGMLRYQDGYYDCNGTQVYLQFSRAHDGTFGAIINAEGLAALQAIYGVTKFGVDNSNCVYTSKF